MCYIYTYTPNQQQFSAHQLAKIIEQLSRQFIFVGDFNSHNTLWVCEHTDAMRKKIEKLLEIDNILFLNNNSPARFNVANGSLSAIDLTRCNNNITIGQSRMDR